MINTPTLSGEPGQAQSCMDRASDVFPADDVPFNTTTRPAVTAPHPRAKYCRVVSFHRAREGTIGSVDGSAEPVGDHARDRHVGADRGARR